MTNHTASCPNSHNNRCSIVGYQGAVLPSKPRPRQSSNCGSRICHRNDPRVVCVVSVPNPVFDASLRLSNFLHIFPRPNATGKLRKLVQYEGDASRGCIVDIRIIVYYVYIIRDTNKVDRREDQSPPLLLAGLLVIKAFDVYLWAGNVGRVKMLF